LRRGPIAALSSMTGISRKHLHAIILGAGVSADYCALLTRRRSPLDACSEVKQGPEALFRAKHRQYLPERRTGG
jgi:hypothetical protein